MTSSSRLRAQHTKLACNFIIASYNFCCCLFTFHFSCLLCCFALWNACMRKHSQSSTMNRPIPNEKKKWRKSYFCSALVFVYVHFHICILIGMMLPLFQTSRSHKHSLCEVLLRSTLYRYLLALLTLLILIHSHSFNQPIGESSRCLQEIGRRSICERAKVPIRTIIQRIHNTHTSYMCGNTYNCLIDWMLGRQNKKKTRRVSFAQAFWIPSLLIVYGSSLSIRSRRSYTLYDRSLGQRYW